MNTINNTKIKCFNSFLYNPVLSRLYLSISSSVYSSTMLAINLNSKYTNMLIQITNRCGIINILTLYHKLQ